MNYNYYHDPKWFNHQNAVNPWGMPAPYPGVAPHMPNSWEHSNVEGYPAEVKREQPPSMQQEPPLAMAFVNIQTFRGINTPEEALRQGTAFPELYRPYTPRSDMKGGHRHE